MGRIVNSQRAVDAWVRKTADMLRNTHGIPIGEAMRQARQMHTRRFYKPRINPDMNAQEREERAAFLESIGKPNADPNMGGVRRGKPISPSLLPISDAALEARSRQRAMLRAGIKLDTRTPSQVRTDALNAKWQAFIAKRKPNA